MNQTFKQITATYSLGCPLKTNAVLVRLCPSNDGRG